MPLNWGQADKESMNLQLLTPADVSKLLAVSIKGVHELCRSGRLDYVKVNGKERRFTPDMVQAFIEAQTVSRSKKEIDKTARKPLPSPPRKGGVKSVEDIGTSLGKEIRDLCR